MRLRLFVALSAALVAAAFALKSLPFAPDPFATGDAARLLRFAQLDEHAMAALKLRHGLAAPAVDLALFGNSRIVQVSAADVGAPRDRFFNFAVPGSSLRQTAALLEELAANGRAPKMAAISLDHFELSFYSAAHWPQGPTSWRSAAADVAWILRRYGPMLAARAAHDHVRQFGLRLAETFSFARLAARAGFFAPGLVPALREFGVGFRADGSRPMVGAPAPDQPAPRPAGFRLHRPFLLRDLERLAAVQRGGVRLLIFESPLSPPNQRRVAGQPRPEVEALRRDWLAACRDLGLACLPAPALAGGERQETPWPDCCHAPAALLGPFIAGALRQAAAAG